MTKKIIILLMLFSIVLPSFSFAQINPPETMDEVKEAGIEALKLGEKELPSIFKRIWKEDALPIWTRMWNWLKEKVLSRLRKLVMPEYEKRKQYLEESFETEKDKLKEEIKEEVPKISKSLIEKFKDLIE